MSVEIAEQVDRKIYNLMLLFGYAVNLATAHCCSSSFLMSIITRCFYIMIIFYRHLLFIFMCCCFQCVYIPKFLQGVLLLLSFGDIIYTVIFIYLDEWKVCGSDDDDAWVGDSSTLAYASIWSFGWLWIK